MDNNPESKRPEVHAYHKHPVLLLPSGPDKVEALQSHGFESCTRIAYVENKLGIKVQKPVDSKNSIMNLDQQIDILRDNAPNHGISPIVIEKAIAPALKMFAKQLKHEHYYLLQNLQQGWILTTLSNRSQPQQQKKVIYAFATSKDAMTFANSSDPGIVADSVEGR